MGRRIRFTNFYEHKADSRFMVYEYFHEEHADHFEKLLQDRQVKYERFLDEEDDTPVILFGVEKRYLSASDQSNYLTHAHFRNPLIESKLWRWVLLIVVAFVITVAMIGYFKTI